MTKRNPGKQALRAPLAERLWDQTEKTATHWWYLGARDPDGYGRICEGGAAVRGAKYLRAHRAAWIVTYGPIPDGMQVLHKCDEPQCVRPEHLFLGTNLDNVADRESKHRNRFGERHGNAKLTDQAVREIRDVYFAGGISQEKLGKAYGVDQTIISDVVLYNYWRHVV